MDNEKIEATMQFIVEQQAQIAANFQKAEEAREKDAARTEGFEKSFAVLMELTKKHDERVQTHDEDIQNQDERLAALTGAQIRANERLTDIQIRSDERLAALTEAQIRANERLTDVQIRSDERLAALAEAQIRTDEQFRRTDELFRRADEAREKDSGRIKHLEESFVVLVRLAKSHNEHFESHNERLAALTEAQIRTDEQLREAGERGKETDERLNALIAMVERYLSDRDKNGSSNN
jgi:hypothetical protein